MKHAYLLLTRFLFIGFIGLFAATSVLADDDDDEDEEEFVDTVYRLEAGMNQLARQEVTTRLEPLGFGLMGDSIDPVTGTLVFNQTDVSLPGNSNLEVAIHRMASSGEMTNYQEMFFGDWMLNTPQISRIISDNKLAFIETKTTRNLSTIESSCDIAASRLHTQNSNLYSFEDDGTIKNNHYDEVVETETHGETYSDGIKLSIPGNADQNLISILNTAAVNATWSSFDIAFNQYASKLQGKIIYNTSAHNYDVEAAEELSPGTVSLKTFVTKNHWVVECQGDKTLLATSPEGTKYKFAKLVFMQANDFQGAQIGVRFSRLKAISFATEVVDVHGNWVKYDYTTEGKLTRIHSNDGREITLTYIPDSYKISTVSANGRTWKYEYRDTIKEMHGMQMKSVLHKVIQPDGNYWEYDLNGLTRSPRPGNSLCQPVAYRDKYISVKHPYGVKADYKLGVVRHAPSVAKHNARQRYRSYWDDYVQRLEPGCNPNPAPNPEFSDQDNGYVGIVGEDAILPSEGLSFLNTLSVLSKTLTGPSIPESTWAYDYEEIVSLAPKPFKAVAVTDPVGRKKVSYFYNEILNDEEDFISPNESQTVFQHRILQRRISKQEDYSAQGQLMQKKEIDYAIGTRLGIDRTISAGRIIRGNGDARAPISYLRDIYNVYKIREVTDRDGDTFTREYTYNTDLDSPDYSYGQPLTVKTYSNVSTTPRVTENTYTHRKDHWVLNLPESVTVNGREMERNGYDSVGKLSWVEQYGHRVADFTYKDYPEYFGSLESFIDAEGRVTKYQDYFLGIARTIERNDGSTDYVNVDDNGWVIGQTDYRGYTTGFERDSMGRVTKIIPSKTQSAWFDTNISYEFGDQVVQTITRGKNQQVVTYDNFLRTVQEKARSLSTNQSIYTASAYNEAGEMVFQSFPKSSLPLVDGTEFTYDGLGRRKTVTENVTPYVSSSYDYLNSHRTQITDPLGNKTTRYKNGFGELTRIIQAGSVDTQLQRNEWGQLVRLLQQGTQNGYTSNQSQYSYYDDRQRLCRHRTPEGGDTLYQYDNSGHMIAYAKGQASGSNCAVPSGLDKVTMKLDALARVEKMDYEDGNTDDVESTYDENGNVKSLRRGSSTWLYGYNELNLLTNENLYIDGKTYSQSYLYNRQADMYRHRLPSGRYVHYGLDGLGRHRYARYGSSARWGENDLIASQVVFYPNGLIQGMLYANGQRFTQALTDRQQPLRTKSVKGTEVALDYTYTYDARSSITNIDDRTTSNFDQQFTYDALDRLDTATGPWGQGSFKYDALGNIREKTLGSRRVTIQYDNRNRAISNTDTANGNRQIRYDNRGNVNILGDLSFTYDQAQQPVSISGKANGTYEYDGNFKRVKSVVDGKTVYNVYNAAGKLVYVDKVTEGKATEYIRLNGKSIARVTDGEITYLHNDHLGSPLAGTDDQGNILWTERYTPFGEKWLNNAANDDLGSYTGHIDDSATGLTYMQARYYDPTIGRFLSIDPVGFRASKPELFNRYSYVSNNPHKYIDPFGLDGTDDNGKKDDDELAEQNENENENGLSGNATEEIVVTGTNRSGERPRDGLDDLQDYLFEQFDFPTAEGSDAVSDAKESLLNDTKDLSKSKKKVGSLPSSSGRGADPQSTNDGVMMAHTLVQAINAGRDAAFKSPAGVNLISEGVGRMQ